MSTARWMTASAVGGLVILVAAGSAWAQPALESAEASSPAVASLASFPPGAIDGIVLDEKGAPVAGAVVSAVGGSSTVAVTDKSGRFELRGLQPGPYLVRAHLSGFVTPPAQIVHVRSSIRSDSSIALRHVGSSPPQVLAAGFGVPAGHTAPAPAADPATGRDAGAGKTDEGETAWRIRHARRSILKDLTLPADVLAGDTPPDATKTEAADFLSHVPFSGRVDLLTSSSFSDTTPLFTPNNVPAGIANLSVTAPVGDHADWRVRGAVTQADMAAWIVSGAYATRGPARHQYNFGASYSAQRFDAGNPLALNAATNSRSAAEVFGFDTFTVSPVVAVTYGARLARYDYLDGRDLTSPRLELALTPADALRIRALIAESAQAPGAEEFLPPSETGVWLPPQRLFSSLDPDAPLRAEHTTHAALVVEHDLGSATLQVRAFHQHATDQLVTVFDADLPQQPLSRTGQYLVANAGNTVASGCAVGVRAAVTPWLRGAVEYSVTDAQLGPAVYSRVLVLAAPSAAAARSERIHSVSTRIETKLPETATRVLVLYQVGNGYARAPVENDPSPERSAIDSRFDVQVRQSLPFMNFTSAKWEMLVGVRNFFWEPGTAEGQSAYDELLVVRPPKRIVGGLTMQF